MTATIEPDEPPRTERAQVEDWREHILIEAGYPADDAIEFSRRTDVDLHKAVDLIQHGCNPTLAADILR